MWDELDMVKKGGIVAWKDLFPRGFQTLVEWKKAAVMKHNMGDSCPIFDELRRRTPEGKVAF